MKKDMKRGIMKKDMKRGTMKKHMKRDTEVKDTRKLILKKGLMKLPRNLLVQSNGPWHCTTLWVNKTVISHSMKETG